ncbi:MAG: hypothetical protein K0U66_05330 [Gammaproteobacteria bacterium]|nr:hypothetical protein [Pseudomonadota bacterium]MCH9663062.1 hypothetical protein [Gammaproteobacteria bacterium]
MYDNACDGLALYIGHLQSLKSHVSVAATTPSPTDNLAGVVAHDNGEIAEAFRGVYIANVGAPGLVRIDGFSVPSKPVVVDAGVG